MDTVKKKRAASREPARSEEGEGGGLFEGGKDKFPFRW